MPVNKLTSHVRKGNLDLADAVVENYSILTSHEVEPGGRGRSKVAGTVLHVSKASSFALSKRVGEKKIKRPVTNYRLVFCRCVCCKCNIQQRVIVIKLSS